MKKDSLLKMKDLPATEEMLAVAREDVPVKVGSGWNTSYRCRYGGFARSTVEDGILKVTLYDPDAMRLGDVYKRQAESYTITYNPVRSACISKDALERLKDEHPDIYDQYVTVSEWRRFHVKKAALQAA